MLSNKWVAKLFIASQKSISKLISFLLDLEIDALFIFSTNNILEHLANSNKERSWIERLESTNLIYLMFFNQLTK